MNTTLSKGIKPYILKAIIVAMSLLYLLGPVHVEINKLLHTIAHSLEMPDNIISHKESVNKNSKAITHKSKIHKSNTDDHDHEVIAFLNKILEGSNQTNDSSDTYIITYKIDKHIQNTKYHPKNEVSKITSLEVRHCFPNNKKRVCKGYLWGLRKPPQT